MATPVLMPKQGQSVESCIIVGWKKQQGDPVAAGETLCEVETDKALLEVESPASGTLLEIFFQEGEEVPVLTHIAAIGEAGEDVADLRPDVASAPSIPGGPPVAAPAPATAGDGQSTDVALSPPVSTPQPAVKTSGQPARVAISPRAKKLAQQRGVDITALQGSGPGGRIIERDVQAAIARQPSLTPLARSMLAEGRFEVPERGTGVSGRIMAGDLRPAVESRETAGEVTAIPVKGVRRIIAERMLDSLQTTAQLTLNRTAEARALLAYRQRLKASAEPLGLQQVTINDLILYAVSRSLLQFPELNARFQEETIYRYDNVHLGVAVDTPRGLMVPVIRRANRLSLKQISQESTRLAGACVEGTISPDDLAGGTFTVTNLGHLGIETFTPVLNAPEVGILGVGNINLKPVEVEGEIEFVPHIGLSLTLNHQVIDGAPAARFLQTLAQGLAEIDLLLAM